MQRASNTYIFHFDRNSGNFRENVATPRRWQQRQRFPLWRKRSTGPASRISGSICCWGRGRVDEQEVFKRVGCVPQSASFGFCASTRATCSISVHVVETHTRRIHPRHPSSASGWRRSVVVFHFLFRVTCAWCGGRPVLGRLGSFALVSTYGFRFAFGLFFFQMSRQTIRVNFIDR